jgi:uncharacterized membrane protein YkoI
VKLRDLSPQVQATIQANINGGRIAEIDKEVKNGVTSYKAEVRGQDGKFFQVFVADDGKLIKVREDKHPKHKHLPLFG